MKQETDDRQKFGRLIRDRRLDRSIGLREFAKKISISAPYLSRIENGHDHPPSAKFIAKMAEVLGIDSTNLFDVANKTIEAFNRAKSLEPTQAEKQETKRIPLDISEAYEKDGVYAKRIPEFLRIAKKKKLTDKEWKELIKSLMEKYKNE